MIRIRFLDPYEAVVDRLVQRMLERGAVQAEPGSDARGTVLKISEAFLRDLIAESFGLQQLDNLVGVQSTGAATTFTVDMDYRVDGVEM